MLGNVQVVDMPLLFETKSQWLFSDIIVVTCTPEQQLERLCNRDSLSQDAASARVRAQLDMSFKAAHATLLIDNSGSKEETLAQVSILRSVAEVNCSVATASATLRGLGTITLLSARCGTSGGCIQ